MIKIYLARAMSNRIKEDVYNEAIQDKSFLERAGITVLDPVIEEGVCPTKEVLMASYEQMTTFWKRDKQMIREAHAVLDMTPVMKSEGVAHELGYARYHLWKKIIRVYPVNKLPPKGSVAYFEDDYLTDNLLDAVRELYQTHGTVWKRIKWRLAILNRCLIKAFIFHLGEFK